MTPAFGDTQSACRKDQFITAIDVGHTKRAGGAVSARGIAEFDFNLRMAGLLHDRLIQAGFPKVKLINADGNEANLRKRTEQANALPVNLLLSIHHDSVQPHYLTQWVHNGKTLYYSDHFRGFSMFISRTGGSPDGSLQFAEHLGDALVAAGFTPTLHHAEPIPGENRDLLDKRKGIYAFDDLTILKTSQVPAVLLECGVIKNRDEETDLEKMTYRRRMADAIVAAIDRYCEASDTGRP